MRYSAFISYSHVDRTWAAWLHRAIEAYRLPRRIRGRPGPFGPIGARLPPVFRDREELSAAPDLGRALSAALTEAETLIVVCSCHSQASRWVNEEIREFVKLGRANRIFCLIVGEAGPPHLPPALMEDGRAEPLAADVRPNEDGREHAKLKLIAGILGISYDELRRRETARRQQQLAAIAAPSVAGLALTSGLAVFAVISRDEAVRQRNVAEQRTLTAKRTVDFVKSMFKAADPSESQGANVSVRQVLDGGAKRIQTELSNEPAVKAELGVTLGEVYESLGLYKQGDQLIRATLSIRHGQDDVTIDQLQALADSEEKLGDYKASIAVDQRAIALAGRSKQAAPEVRSRLFQQLAQAQSDDGQKRRRRAVGRGCATNRPSAIAPGPFRCRPRS
jgi:tetratricopeptide (TPR) repeat protein